MCEKKDYTKLIGVSDKFTEETLKNIISEIHKEQNVEILSWTFSEGSAKGDSYLSTFNKIKITATINGKVTDTYVVVKSLPKNLARRKTYRCTEFFRNEILFYEKVVPRFKEFLVEKGQPQFLCIPRCLASLTDGENDYLVLEDVTLLGFGPITRQNSVNIDQCRTVLKAMATFHAISFAYKDQRKEDFKILAETVAETYFSPKHWSWYKRFHQKLVGISTHALATEYPNSTAEKRFLSYKFGDLFDKNKQFCDRKHAPTSVINQGDSWAPNFMIRKIDQNKQDVLMLDFQLARCVSPVLDISFFICSCTDKSLRDKYFDDMLKTYHNTLCSVITSLGSEPEKLYSWTTFMSEVQEQFLYGVTFAMESIPFCLLSEDESFDLDAIMKGDDAVDIDDVWTLSNIQTKEGRLRLADVIADAVARGYF